MPLPLVSTLTSTSASATSSHSIVKAVAEYRLQLTRLIGTIALELQTLRVALPYAAWQAVLSAALCGGHTAEYAAVLPAATQPVVDFVFENLLPRFIETNPKYWTECMGFAFAGRDFRDDGSREYPRYLRCVRVRLQASIEDSVHKSSVFGDPQSLATGRPADAAAVLARRIVQAAQRKRQCAPQPSRVMTLEVPPWVFDAVAKVAVVMAPVIREALVQKLHAAMADVTVKLTRALHAVYLTPTALALAFSGGNAAAGPEDTAANFPPTLAWAQQSIMWTRNGPVSVAADTTLLGRIVAAMATCPSVSQFVTMQWLISKLSIDNVCVSRTGALVTPGPLWVCSYPTLVRLCAGVFDAPVQKTLEKIMPHARNALVLCAAKSGEDHAWDAHRTIGRMLDMCQGSPDFARKITAVRKSTTHASTTKMALVMRDAVQAAYRLAFSPVITAKDLARFLRHVRTQANPALMSLKKPFYKQAVDVRVAVNTALYLLCGCDNVSELPLWPAEEVCGADQDADANGDDDTASAFSSIPLLMWEWATLGVPTTPDLQDRIQEAGPVAVRLAQFMHTREMGSGAARRLLKCVRSRQQAQPWVSHEGMLFDTPLETMLGPKHRVRVLTGGAKCVDGIWRAMMLETCELAFIDEVGLAALALVVHGSIQRAVRIDGMPASLKTPSRTRQESHAASVTAATCVLCSATDAEVAVFLPSCGNRAHGVCGPCTVDMLLMQSRKSLGLLVTQFMPHVEPDGTFKCFAAEPPCTGVFDAAVLHTARTSASTQAIVLPAPVAAVAALNCGKGPLPRSAGTSEPDCIRCAACSSWVAAPHMATEGPVVTCGHCALATCARCGLESHPGTVCSAALAVTPATLLNQVKGQACPGCKVTTTKYGSCNHMRCVSCGVHWCWLCGGAINRLEDHFSDVVSADARSDLPCAMFAYSLEVECARMEKALQGYITGGASGASGASAADYAEVARQALLLLQTSHRQSHSDL